MVHGLVGNHCFVDVWAYRDMSLRGMDLSGFDVEAVDGTVGRVERAVTEPTGGYLVVDVGSLAPIGARALLPAGVVDTVDLDLERLFVRWSREEIRNAPPYDWRAPLDARSREEFAAYYGGGQPKRERARLRAARTKAELYEEAKRREIVGRSRMSKGELAHALELEQD